MSNKRGSKIHVHAWSSECTLEEAKPEVTPAWCFPALPFTSTFGADFQLISVSFSQVTVFFLLHQNSTHLGWSVSFVYFFFFFFGSGIFEERPTNYCQRCWRTQQGNRQCCSKSQGIIVGMNICGYLILAVNTGVWIFKLQLPVYLSNLWKSETVAVHTFFFDSPLLVPVENS